MLVSVIIPCYNVEEYIEECIESVVSQTYKNIQIICVDNNSTDNTWVVLCVLKEKYPLVIVKELNAGASAARNKGLSIAQGEWIQFLDADDLLLPSKIEHQLNLVHCNNVGFVAGAWINRALNGIEKDIIQFNQNIFIAVFKSQSGNTCSNLWRKQVLNHVNGWDEDLKSSQETDLMMRIALHGIDFFIDAIPLTIIRERESGQISHRDPEEKWCQYVDIRFKYLNELKQRYSESYYQNKKIFYEFLLISLSILATYDRNSALKRFNSQVKTEVDVFDLKFAFIKLFGFNLYLKLKFVLKNFKTKRFI